jgi:hypothetical protein
MISAANSNGCPLASKQGSAQIKSPMPEMSALTANLLMDGCIFMTLFSYL